MYTFMYGWCGGVGGGGGGGGGDKSGISKALWKENSLCKRTLHYIMIIMYVGVWIRGLKHIPHRVRTPPGTI